MTTEPIPCVLSYALTTVPNPLTASSPGVSPVNEDGLDYGSIDLVISNSGSTPVRCSRIAIVLPVGPLAQDLALTGEGIDPYAEPASGWTIVGRRTYCRRSGSASSRRAGRARSPSTGCASLFGTSPSATRPVSPGSALRSGQRRAMRFRPRPTPGRWRSRSCRSTAGRIRRRGRCISPRGDGLRTCGRE